MDIGTLVGLELECCCRGGHQQGGRNTFAGHIRDHDLHPVRVNGNLAVEVTADYACGLHHASHVQTWNGGLAARKEHPLHLRCKFHIMEKVIALVANLSCQGIALSSVPLDDGDNEDETDKSSQIVAYAGTQAGVWRAEQIVQEDTDDG